MRIFISGSTGLVGRNILEKLAAEKFELLTPSSSELNLLDYTKVFEYIKTQKPDVIIHCAGKVGGIQANMKDPYGFLMENLVMGTNLVTAAKNADVKKFLNLSSSCAYPRNAQSPLTEDLILKGELEPTNEGYALAKITIMKMCEYITQENNGFYYKTMIPCNLYGKWDKFSPENSHMIPGVIRKIHEAKRNNLDKIETWGDGTARREFMYAGDLADCICTAIKDFESLPTVMNVGIGDDFSINEYYEIIAKVIGYKGSFTRDLTKPVGMKQKLLNVEKQKIWGWKAQNTLEEGIKKTYEFYREQEQAYV
ncbi:MAG TPA: GDP-L-fucose synthase [Candidatus Gastranaerophilales bacterium]|nr:GDP-L-fucose synthase [Candidatus Gastranaerophilales bacterium]